MRKKIAAASAIAIAFAVATMGCRQKESEAPPSKAAAQPAEQAGDTNFSPPEIRRPMPHDTDSIPATSGTPASIPAPTKPVATAAPAAVKPATTVAPAQPAPVAKAAAKPAAVAPPPPPKPTPAAPATPVAGTPLADPGPDGDWVLQVNVHKSEADASGQVAKLASEGIPAYSVVVPTEGGGLAGRYWRVRVGRFKTRAEAQSYGETRILPRGLKFWIDRKSNESRPVGGN